MEFVPDPGFVSSSMESVIGGTGPSVLALPSSPESPDGNVEIYSRKVFLGGLPQDISEEDIYNQFRKYGRLLVDWPFKKHSSNLFPPNGFAFLIFEEESSIHKLHRECTWVSGNGRLFYTVSSLSIKNKVIEVRPWKLSDTLVIMGPAPPAVELNRQSVFVGGLPRNTTAAVLVTMMSSWFGEVNFAEIFLNKHLKYPKGSGRVVFSDEQGYRSALLAGQFLMEDKQVELKPFVTGDQQCGHCRGLKCNGAFATCFCMDLECLQYYCLACWTELHITRGHHRPLVWGWGSEGRRGYPLRF